MADITPTTSPSIPGFSPKPHTAPEPVSTTLVDPPTVPAPTTAPIASTASSVPVTLAAPKTETILPEPIQPTLQQSSVATNTPAPQLAQPSMQAGSEALLKATTLVPPTVPPKRLDIGRITKKIPYVAGLILVLALMFLAVTYVILQQSGTPKIAQKPTPTATAAPTPSGTPTPFPTATVSKSLYVSLLDNKTVKSTAEIGPDGTVVSTKAPVISQYQYVKTDKNNAVTEFGEISPDGKYRAKITPSAITIASTETPTSFQPVAKAGKGSYLYGYFISNTQLAFSYVPVPCNIERTCTKRATSTVIYDIPTNKLKELRNQEKRIPSIYVGSNVNFHIFTQDNAGKTPNVYYLIGRANYSYTMVTVPDSILSTLLWGPQLDLTNGRLMYLSKGFTDTVEIGYFDLQTQKETVKTEIPAIAPASSIKAGQSIRYNMHYFKDFTLAYIGIEYVQAGTETEPEEKVLGYKTYYYSAPDSQAKEFTANPDLKNFFMDDKTEMLAFNPTTSQIAVLFGGPKNILIIDSQDIAHPAIQNIAITGALPTYNNAFVSGWKE